MNEHIGKWSPVRTAAEHLNFYATLMMHGADVSRPFYSDQAERELRKIADAMGFDLVRNHAAEDAA